MTMLVPQVEDLNKVVNKLATNLAEGVHQTIQMLTQIVDMSERFYEGSHSRWVSRKSEQLASSVGMKSHYVFQTKVAAQLHDLGKFMFKDSCLYKHSNDMSPSELSQYKYHPEIGASIIEKHANMEGIAKIVLQHHERLDGSGFPNHLKGSEISISAQIIGIVDIYHNIVFKKPISDCITSKYRQPTFIAEKFIDETEGRHQKACNYLISKSRTLFDRNLVDIFLDIVEEDRVGLNGRSVRKIYVNMIQEGMTIAKDYHTSFGLLIAANGDNVTKSMSKAMMRFAENGELPYKILVYNSGK